MIALLAADLGAAPAPAPTTRVDARIRRAVIDELTRQLHARYVFPDSVARIEAHLRSRLGAGAYGQAKTPPAFAAAVTQDLRAFDLHFDLRMNPELERALRAAGSDTATVLPELALSPDSLAVLRRGNFAFRSARLLPANVGYLELAGLQDLRLARPTAVAAIEFLAHADAIILDLREVPGGYGNMVQFLASCFFAPDSVELLTSYDRELGTTEPRWTSPTTAARPLRHVELLVLTSGSTGSAGEALAFALKVTGRATLVGERTAGAAHAGGWVPLGLGLVAFVPNARSFDPRTGGTGSAPGSSPRSPCRLRARSTRRIWRRSAVSSGAPSMPAAPTLLRG